MEWKRNESVYIVACRRFLIVLGDFFLASFGILSNFLRTEQTLSNFCLPGQPFSNFWPCGHYMWISTPLRFVNNHYDSLKYLSRIHVPRSFDVLLYFFLETITTPFIGSISAALFRVRSSFLPERGYSTGSFSRTAVGNRAYAFHWISELRSSGNWPKKGSLELWWSTII